MMAAKEFRPVTSPSKRQHGGPGDIVSVRVPSCNPMAFLGVLIIAASSS